MREWARLNRKGSDCPALGRTVPRAKAQARPRAFPRGERSIRRSATSHSAQTGGRGARMHPPVRCRPQHTQKEEKERLPLQPGRGAILQRGGRGTGHEGAPRRPRPYWAKSSANVRSHRAGSTSRVRVWGRAPCRRVRRARGKAGTIRIQRSEARRLQKTVWEYLRFHSVLRDPKHSEVMIGTEWKAETVCDSLQPV